jgi:hypothetical protein
VGREFDAEPEYWPTCSILLSPIFEYAMIRRENVVFRWKIEHGCLRCVACNP